MQIHNCAYPKGSINKSDAIVINHNDCYYHALEVLLKPQHCFTVKKKVNPQMYYFIPVQ